MIAPKAIVVVVLTILANMAPFILLVDSEMLPPKSLTRVVAGFYSFHPIYDSDQPAPIASTKSIMAAASSTDSKDRPRQYYHHRPVPPKTSKPPPVAAPKPETIGYNLDHHYIERVFRVYLAMAKKLAIEYGQLYNYPVDVLYRQIVKVMFY